ncbi:MAG: hypothetical protein IJW01_07435 [Paludibacteraceae bacterium]|nr:hypothetical protein [Paludibacteraceae bacterium]
MIHGLFSILIFLLLLPIVVILFAVLFFRIIFWKNTSANNTGTRHRFVFKPKKREKKFDKDDGEYVDYEEIDDKK